MHPIAVSSKSKKMCSQVAKT